MQLRNFILIGSFAAMAATGAAMAQSGSAGASGSTGGAGATAAGSTSSNPADRMPTDLGKPLNGARDKARNGNGTSGSASTSTTGPNGTNGAGPISVTPPSQDNPNTAVDVNTDPAKAHAAAGTNGVNANAQLTSPDQATPKGNNGARLKKKATSGSGQ